MRIIGELSANYANSNKQFVRKIRTEFVRIRIKHFMDEQKKETLKNEGEEIKSEFARAKTEFKSEVVDKGDPKILAAIGYLWILFLVPLLFKKDDPFCQHHGKQGLVLFIFSLIVSLLGGLPVIGWLLIAPLGWIITVALMILGILKALQGELWEMPYLGKFAKKINF
jgi:uncharacterized membrane protein